MLEAGQELPEQRFTVTRAHLVRYAGASGDFNPIHWSERFAVGVGLPGVIAHGMFTMALAGRAVTAWAGRADAVVDFGVRFTRPVPVPDTDEGAEVVFTGTVKKVEGGLAHIELSAVCGDEKVLAQARAIVRQADEQA
jgi:acyl dehydratase